MNYHFTKNASPFYCYGINNYIKYRITAITVLVKPTHASNGISFILSLMFMNTEPPVAWKKEPCGSESTTVAPA